MDLTELVWNGCPDYKHELGHFIGTAPGEVWVMGSPIMDRADEWLSRHVIDWRLEHRITGRYLGFHIWYYARLDKAGHLERNKSVWNLAEGCPW